MELNRNRADLGWRGKGYDRKFFRGAAALNDALLCGKLNGASPEFSKTSALRQLAPHFSPCFPPSQSIASTRSSAL